jgi:LacI family transcriptional regulator
LPTTSVQERIVGYRDALAAVGLAEEPSLVVRAGASIEDARAACCRLLDRGDPPGAVVCTDNVMTFGLLHALADRGLDCPRDIAIACFDDIPSAAAFLPRLTALAQPARAMGVEAVDLLFSRLAHGNIGLPVRRVLKGNLIIRESSTLHPRREAAV